MGISFDEEREVLHMLGHMSVAEIMALPNEDDNFEQLTIDVESNL